MTTDFFKGIKQWEVDQNGWKGKLPVFYYDTTSINAIYTASTAKVKSLLPLADMHPVELFPGRALIAFTAFEYRKTDIDPYNEFSIAFPITFGTKPIPFVTAGWQMARRCISAYVWQLPVTTEIARQGGVEMYGFPKFIADIEFARETDAITCNLSEKGEKILTLTGKVLPTKPEKITRYVTYSVIDGIALRANVFINPVQFAQTTSRQAARLELGTSHSIPAALKGLDLSANPVTYQYSPLNQGILYAGRNLMDD